MYSMAKYNFENYLENASAPLYRNSAKVLALEDQNFGKTGVSRCCKVCLFCFRKLIQLNIKRWVAK